MTDMRDDLRDLGRRIWPDDSPLRPRAAARARRWASTGLTVATAAVMIAVLAVAVARHDRGTAPRVASSPHGRGSGLVVALRMIDASAGWAWGPTLVTRTTDGVATLVDVTPAGIDSAQRVVAEDFLDAQHAWVVAGPASGHGNGTLYRTDDGGGHWTPVALDVDPGSVTFVDPQHGWLEAGHLAPDHVTTQIVLMRTLDGGATWSTVYRTAQRQTVEPNGPKGDCGWSTPVFATTELGFEGLSCDDGGGPRIDVTHDGGSTWERVQLPPLPNPPAGTLMSTSVAPLRLVSAHEAVVAVNECIGDGTSCSLHSALYLTTDAALSWTATGPSVVTSGEVVASDPDHAWVLQGTALLLTDDGGRTWAATALPVELERTLANQVSYQFLSPTLGYAVSLVGRLGPIATHFYRTTDGGHHFAEFAPLRTLGPGPTLRSVPAQAFTSDNIVLALPGRAPRVSEAAAERIAEATYHDVRVQEIVLAEVVNHGAANRLCWVVAMPPKDAGPFEPPPPLPGHTSAPSPAATYLVLFIDADTGTPIFSTSGSIPTSPTPS